MRFSNITFLVFVLALIASCSSVEGNLDESDINEDISKSSEELIEPISVTFKLIFPSSLIGKKVDFLRTTDSKVILNSFTLNGVAFEEEVKVDSA